MRNIIVFITAIAMTGCATVPEGTYTTSRSEVQQKNSQAKTIVTSLLVLGATLAIANKVADDNRNKQCKNDKFLYRGVGNDRYYVCP
jgi:starvation-inducible outer membrane lipoprotein